MQPKRGFTLIEVLVVVAIIALLVGIFMPSLSGARRQARLVACATQLSQIGKALLAYLPENRDRMPWISQMPSIGAAPLISKDATKTVKPVWLPDVLRRHLGGGRTAVNTNRDASDPTSPVLVKDNAAFQCQNDKPNFTTRSAPNAGKSYFESERSSYEYRTRLNGLLPSEFGEAVIHRHGGAASGVSENMPSNTVWIARDWDNFHST
jgi:prepilin-type N-terminal cleavage/methylation domain-containing protein